MEAATGNERRPAVDRRYCGMCSCSVNEDRRRRRPGTETAFSSKLAACSGGLWPRICFLAAKVSRRLVRVDVWTNCSKTLDDDIAGSVKKTACTAYTVAQINKKAQLSLTNPRDAKACQKLLQFDVLTTLSLTILAYLHSFSCCCVRNLRNPARNSLKIQTYGVQGHPRSSILVSIESQCTTSY